MAASMAAVSLVAIVVYAFQYLSILFTASAAPLGFSFDIIHRDSIASGRSIGPDATGSPFSDTVPITGDYLMKLQIGTPPVEVMGLLDTGSDLVWLQCLPCIHCYDQKAPKFNPITSSTYRDAACSSSQCQTFNKINCDTSDNFCPYELHYGDGSSFTIGTIGIDAFTLPSTSGQPVVLPDAILGCGHNNSGFADQTPGIIGLGWREYSLVSQLGDSIQGLFSYCFGAVYNNKTGKINFGANAIVSGAGTLSTFLYKKDSDPGKYFVNLDAISVNDTRIETSGTSFHATNGNIFLDSGTTLTIIPRDYYSRVEEAVMNMVKAERIDPPSHWYKLCYKTTNFLDFPIITMHFTNADLVLGRLNTYLKLNGGITCLGIVYSDSLPNIYGNRAQENFLVGYDTYSGTISFKAVDCGSLWD